MILDENASTDEALGTYPDQKTIEQRLEGGFFLLDKGAGPTSHQVAAWVRDLLGLTRLGHGGTLDPFATGVLPLMAGKSMRLTKQILEHDKTYIALFQMKTPVDEDRVHNIKTKKRSEHTSWDRQQRVWTTFGQTTSLQRV